MAITRTTAISKTTILTSTPEIAFQHARITGPFPEGEAIISTDAKYSCWYAKYVLKGRFKLGESIIQEDARMSLWYLNEVILRDFAGEHSREIALKAAFGLG